MKPRNAEAARLEADYLTRVKAAIAGREASEIDEIIESLRDHIEEEVSEAADDRVSLVQMANVLEQLGPPEAYALDDGAQPSGNTAADSRTNPSGSTTDNLEPRRSKLAVAAALCVPAAIVVFALLAVLAGNHDAGVVAAGLACCAVLFTGASLGFVALLDIRRTPQKLRGKGLAWFALSSPVLLALWCLLMYAVSFSRERSAESAAEREADTARARALAAERAAHDNHFTFDSDEGKLLIARAASMSKEELAPIEEGHAMELKDFKSQSLTVWFLDYGPKPGELDNKKMLEEFDFGRRAPDAQKVIEALKDGPVPPSLLQPQRIRHITTNFQGNTAGGVIEFQFLNIGSGKIHFVAKKNDGAWRITQFILPVRGVAVVLADDGLWRVVRTNAQ